MQFISPPKFVYVNIGWLTDQLISPSTSEDPVSSFSLSFYVCGQPTWGRWLSQFPDLFVWGTFPAHSSGMRGSLDSTALLCTICLGPYSWWQCMASLNNWQALQNHCLFVCLPNLNYSHPWHVFSQPLFQVNSCAAFIISSDMDSSLSLITRMNSPPPPKLLWSAWP